MNLTFSHALRVLLCAECRAIVHVATDGGAMSCSACGQHGEIVARDQCSTLQRRDGQVETSEAEQRERLRPQQGERLEIPESLADLVRDDPMAPDYEPDQLQRALRAWDQARADIMRGGATEQQFYFLTVSLQRELFRGEDEQMLRALLETAIETVRSPRYEQMLRCELACQAARAGDLTAAEDWLMVCDRRSADIHADSAFRFAHAYVSSRKRSYKPVLEVLGERYGEVPFAAGREGIIGLLRANAIERLGDADAAAQDLMNAIVQSTKGADGFDLAQSLHADMALCPRTYWTARDSAQAAPVADEEQGSPAERPAARRWQWMVAILAWVVVVAAVIWAFVL